MASGTIPAPSARTITFNVQSGHKVVITLSGTNNVFSLLITTAGAVNYNSMHLVSGYSTVDASHYINTIVAGSSITVTKSSGKIEVSATGSSGYRVSITPLFEDPNGVSAELVSTS